jgi:hypothetical protein
MRVKNFHFATVATYTHQYSIPPLPSQSKPSKSEDLAYETHPTACLFEFVIKTQLDLLSSCCGTRIGMSAQTVDRTPPSLNTL